MHTIGPLLAPTSRPGITITRLYARTKGTLPVALLPWQLRAIHLVTYAQIQRATRGCPFKPDHLHIFDNGFLTPNLISFIGILLRGSVDTRIIVANRLEHVTTTGIGTAWPTPSDVTFRPRSYLKNTWKEFLDKRLKCDRAR